MEPTPLAESDASIAIVHEWIESRTGSEQVFERMARNLPEADLFALTAEPEHGLDVGGREIATSILQNSGSLRRRRAIALPAMPLAWWLMRPAQYDIVISSSHAFSRYFPAGDASHISYVHAPMRYAWSPEIDARGAFRGSAIPRKWLRHMDSRTVDRVSEFAANSREVARRVEKFYGRECQVLPPPVDLSRFNLHLKARGGFILGFSRWVPYKRMDLVIAVGEAVGLPVVIAGRGPEANRLRQLGREAKVPVSIVESPSDEEVVKLYSEAEMLVFPAHEDFGIVPVEAQACGTKVVALGVGGACDTVIDGETGALSATQAVDDLAAAVRRCLEIGDAEVACRLNALRFDASVFDERFLAWVASHL